MIPFERGSSREPERDTGEPHARLARSGPDAALVRELELRRAARPRAGLGEVLASWLVAPLMLAAVAAGLLLVVRGPDALFGWAFGSVLFLGSAWIIASSLFPARAERTCPACGAEALVRLDAHTTRGLRCSACAWRDPLSSSFLLAEDDGAPLEELALRERSRKRRW